MNATPQPSESDKVPTTIECGASIGQAPLDPKANDVSGEESATTPGVSPQPSESDKVPPTIESECIRLAENDVSDEERKKILGTKNEFIDDIEKDCLFVGNYLLLPKDQAWRLTPSARADVRPEVLAELGLKVSPDREERHQHACSRREEPTLNRFAISRDEELHQRARHYSSMDDPKLYRFVLSRDELSRMEATTSRFNPYAVLPRPKRPASYGIPAAKRPTH